MKKIVSLAVIILCLATLLPIMAQSPNSILKKAEKAMGGTNALRGIRGWQVKGRITRMSGGASGAYQAQAQQPNLYGEIYDLNGFEVGKGFNGKSGWNRDSRDGLRTLTGDAGADFQAETNYRNFHWFNVKADKSKLAAGGKTILAGKNTNVVLLTTAKGLKIKIYFDTVTNLIVREEIPQGNAVKTLDYGDYRNVNGVLAPFEILIAAENETYRIKLDEVKFNPAINKTDFDFPRLSNEPLPDLKTLLDEIRTNADKIDRILENYSFTELRIDREPDATGNLIEKSSEKKLLSFYKGSRISRLIEKNGKPLSVSAQADEDKNIEKQVAGIEKKIAEKERQQNRKSDVSAGSAGQPSEEGQRITIADALKGSLLTNPRRERFKGIDVIVFDYEPNPAFKPQTRNEKLFALCNGAVWVDAKTKQVVRLEAVLTQSAGNFLAKAKRGASFTLDNELVNNEIWLPSQADVNLSIKILFAGININNLIKYGDYKRFTTEVQKGEVDKPQ